MSGLVLGGALVRVLVQARTSAAAVGMVGVAVVVGAGAAAGTDP